MDERSECTDISLNPFEAESTDSLHLSKFSPSMFKIKNTPSSINKKPNFRWSIDQLAMLHPADIDETPHQDVPIDQNTEKHIQQAIDEFFSQKQVAPSPWADGKQLKHVTFSPHPPSTNYYLDYDIKSADTSVASSNDNSLTSNKPNTVDATCQTCLTLPLDFDLQAVLQSFHSFQQGNLSEILSTSSLRRKLFLPSERSTESESSMNCVQSSHCDNSVFHVSSPSLSPINSARQCKIQTDCPKTPTSVKSQFSSSPKSTPMLTPIGKIHASLISSDMESPPISPIILDNTRDRMQYNENTPCGRSKFCVATPAMSPIPQFSSKDCKNDPVMFDRHPNVGKANVCGVNRENRSYPVHSSLNIANSVNTSSGHRGAPAKLNLLTVLNGEVKSRVKLHQAKEYYAQEASAHRHWSGLSSAGTELEDIHQELQNGRSQRIKDSPKLMDQDYGQLMATERSFISTMDVQHSRTSDAAMLDFSASDAGELSYNDRDIHRIGTMKDDHFTSAQSTVGYTKKSNLVTDGDIHRMGSMKNDHFTSTQSTEGYTKESNLVTDFNGDIRYANTRNRRLYEVNLGQKSVMNMEERTRCKSGFGVDGATGCILKEDYSRITLDSGVRMSIDGNCTMDMDGSI